MVSILMKIVIQSPYEKPCSSYYCDPLPNPWMEADILIRTLYYYS